MLVALTGTPGVGKTTVARILAESFRVVEIHSYAESHGLFLYYDDDAGSYVVDTDRLNESILSEGYEGVTILEGHLSHFVDCDKIIVLRCEPRIIYARLRDRGYDTGKIKENVQAEVLDVILTESMDSHADVHEIDCSSLSPEGIADKIGIIINGDDSGDTSPGRVDWSSEMEEWF